MLSIVMLFLVALSSLVMADTIKCDFRQVSKRIYVIVGSDHEKCPVKEVEHPLTNPAVIVGNTGVIVIDPGSSLQAGQLVLQRLKAITNKPVVAVFIPKR